MLSLDTYAPTGAYVYATYIYMWLTAADGVRTCCGVHVVTENILI